MGWFLIIVGTLLMGNMRLKGDNEWAVAATAAIYFVGCVTVIALGVAVNQEWLR